MKLISIVTICRNNSAELAGTLASFAELDPVLFETIVIDGSPGDECAEVVARHPVSRYIHERDCGKYDAMNKGVAAATGECVLMINSGDTLHDPKALTEIATKNRDRLHSHIVYGDAIRRIDGQRIPVQAPAQITPENIRTGCYPSHQSILIPRRFFERVGYDSAMQISADTKLLREAFSTFPHVREPIPIGVFAFGGISSTPSSWRGVFQHYGEATLARRLNAVERFQLLAQLAGRKLFAVLAGRARLAKMQAVRAKRR